VGRLVVVFFVCGVVAWSSVQAGAPAKLPDVAMGWMLLFHVERAIVLLAAIGAVVLVSWRATYGDFPVKLGQVEYAVREAARDVEGKNEALEKRLRTLEAVVDIRNSHEPGR
jgi:hypothetical protein